MSQPAIQKDEENTKMPEKKCDEKIIEKIKRSIELNKIVDEFTQNGEIGCRDFIDFEKARLNILNNVKIPDKTSEKSSSRDSRNSTNNSNSNNAATPNTSNNSENDDENLEFNFQPKKKKSTWKLITMIILNGIFFVVELIVGIITHSLALQTDAFNMLSDEASVIVGLIVHNYSKKYPSSRMSFGYIRAETIGGLCNSIFMYAIALTIFLNAIELFVDPHEIEHSLVFLITGIIGLIINLFGIIVFNDKNNINMRGVFIHALGDFLGSVGVLISALIQNFCDYRPLKLYIDPVISVVIAIILVLGTTNLFKKTLQIVAETVPSDIDFEKVKKRLLEKVNHIVSIHDFHIWGMVEDEVIAMMHIIIDSPNNRKQVISAVTNYLIAFGIYSSTIQIECLDDFPSGIENNDGRCPFATTYDQQRRVFTSIPIYQHLVGCRHIHRSSEYGVQDGRRNGNVTSIHTLTNGESFIDNYDPNPDNEEHENTEA